MSTSRQARDTAIYRSGVFAILEDFAVQKESLQDMHRAILNILEDSVGERNDLAQAERAIVSILEDFEAEKEGLRNAHRAILNILDDLALENEGRDRRQEELERTERALRKSLREKDALLKEVHHRVKNNLQVVCSLLRTQASSLNDPLAREILSKTNDRILSIALVHERLYQSADLSQVDFGRYVTDLVDSLFLAYGGAQRGVASKLDVGSGAHLAIDLAIPCGLIINELITNCFKYAFCGRDDGVIEVAFRRLDPQRVVLSVADNGVGLPADFDPRATQSLGLELVFAFAQQIEAEVEIVRGGGTRYCFAFLANIVLH